PPDLHPYSLKPLLTPSPPSGPHRSSLLGLCAHADTPGSSSVNVSHNTSAPLLGTCIYPRREHPPAPYHCVILLSHRVLAPLLLLAVLPALACLVFLIALPCLC